MAHGRVMARNAQRIEFRDRNDMAAHLDRWAASALADPAGWEAVLVDSQAWLDYSGRNQALLASYGASGPVAGEETWRLVPSTREGSGCAVRAGEHGYPVRVPVTTGGTEPDPHLGGNRATRAAVERWEWRPVFSLEQLARKPVPGSLVPIEVPAALRGPDATAEFLAAARTVAATTVRGRLGKSSDPYRTLGDAAGRLRRSGKRPELDDVLRGQVAWLVADRVGLAPSERPPSFDPSGLSKRERWERLLDVLEPSRKLTAALGVAVGADLVASPLPRMEIVDDRVVPAGRRHRLPPASLERLPVGEWVTVGPYTPAEWAARGEQAAGQGAFLRLNKSAYLAVVETGDGARWRLEDVATRTGHGLLATGTAATLDDARNDATATIRDRYPALAAPPPTAAPSILSSGPVGDWAPVPGPGRVAAEQRQFTREITLLVMPGPGGRWIPAIHNAAGLAMERLPMQTNRDDARTAAEAAGFRAARAIEVANPALADPALAAFADSPHYSRSELADLIANRLDTAQAERLTVAAPAELAELLGIAGASAATTVAVLHAEHVDADTVAGLLPAIGVPMAESIRVVHERWQVPMGVAAEAVGATATEMRDAGCSAAEIMAARPRDVLRTLPDDPHLWELAAATMANSGHPTSVIVNHLVAHAPSPSAFAQGLTAAADPADGLSFAARSHAQPEHLAAASEAYGLSPAETAGLIVGIAAADVALDTITSRCDGDRDAATALAADAGLPQADIDTWLEPAPATVATVGRIRPSIEIDSRALLAALPTPIAVAEPDPLDLLASLDTRTPSLALETTP